MRRLAIALVAVPLALGGCAGQIGGSLGGIANGALNGALAGIAPTITDDQIVMNHAESHNLKVRLEQIDASNGLVSITTTTGPVVGTPMTPTGPIVVQPLPTPMPVPTPTPTPTPSPVGPVVTPNLRR